MSNQGYTNCVITANKTKSRSAGAVLAVGFLLLSHQYFPFHRDPLELPRMFEFLMNLHHQQLEPFLHVAVRTRTNLRKFNPEFIRQGNSLLRSHVPLVQQVALGGNEYLADVLGRVVVDLSHPAFDVLKGVAVADGIGEDDACCALVVGLRDVLESFLAGGVPDLQFVLAIADGDGFDFEVDAYGGHVGVFEVVFAEACDDVGFAYAAVADDDHFGHEVVLFCLFRLHRQLQLLLSPADRIVFNMEEHNLSSQSVDIKEFFSQVTNVSPEGDEAKTKYGAFISPEAYQLNQSLFNIKELKAQPGYKVMYEQQILYFGGTYNHMKHGLGVMLTADTVYEGQFHLDFKVGKGYQKFPNGSIYFGDFINNRTHGQGSLKFGDQYYVGDFQNGSMQGDGLWKNKHGDKYIGEWKSNKAHGYGAYITKTSHYQGHFSKFVKHGQGVQNFMNGDQYKGMYENGSPHGYGEYYWKDGGVYKGDFVKGLRHGKGKWFSDKGDQYEGEFKDDKKNGSGNFIWANGNTYKGKFVNDVREGEGQMLWKDGSSFKGQWKGGLPNGFGTFKMLGQKPKTGYYENNILIKEVKARQDRRDKARTGRDSLVLAIIPELTKHRNFASKPFRSRDVKSRVTNDTSFGGWQSYRK